jgi:hypothetical protein
MALLCAIVLVGEVRLRADDVETRLTDWVDKIRKGVEEDADLSDVKVVEGKFVDRLFVKGREFRLICEDATEEQLVAIEMLAANVMQGDAQVQAWLARKENIVTASVRAKGQQATPPDERKLVKQLVQEVHDLIEAEIAFAGVAVSDVKFVPAGRGIEMQLLGRLGKKEQQGPLVEKLVNKLLDDLPGWKIYRKQIVVSSLKMEIKPASRERAARLYAHGREAYNNQKFQAAENSFALALVDDPANESYLAWRIMTTLATGDEGRTKVKLVRLLKRDPRALTAGDIAKQFEKVQGPLRQRLNELRNEVLRTLDDGAAK